MPDHLPPEPWCFVGEPRQPKENPLPKKKPTPANEPALYRGAVVAALSLLTALGVSWAADVDKETVGAIATVAAVVVPLVQAWWTRRAVSPAGAIPRRRAIP